jgi:hypothetical protein
VVHDGLPALPEWLLVGVGLGLLCSLFLAGLFVVAARRYPAPSTEDEYHTRSGDSRRRSELREYLDAIEEPYAENHSVEGQRVAFYLPDRDVAITFDPRVYYRLDHSGTDAVLVEHEMPGLHLGYRLPFETPEVTVGAGSDGGVEPAQNDHATDAFEVLDLPATATLEEVRAAYRRKVLEVHPDHGGDEAAFRRVREAYATAKQRRSERAE